MSQDKVYLIDISNIIHRAFYATGELSTSTGFPTGGIYGTMNIMLRLIDTWKPKHLLICYDDQSGKSIRKQIYPDYKKSRTQTTSVCGEEIVLRRLFQMMNMASVVAEGYEADDLIATATAKLKSDMDIVIVSGDKDLLQLIEPGVDVYDDMKRKWYTEVEALQKFGVKANQISDYLALAGDKVDDIPGGAGIGPKAAQDLLGQYGTVDNILANLNSTPIKYRDKLIKSKDNIAVSKKLTDLFQDVDVEITPQSTIFKPTDNPEIFDLLDKLEFKGMSSKLESMWRAYNK